MFVLAFNIRARILASTENHDEMPQIPMVIKMCLRNSGTLCIEEKERDLQHLYTTATNAS